MKTLFIAPQSFFIERGTPIAVKLALEVLAKKDIDLNLLSFNAGKDIQIKNLRHYRSYTPKAFKNIQAGFSFKKVFCDFFLLLKTFRLIISSRKNNPIKLIHAVEESVFIALIIKKIFNIPYIYDMDSCLSDQLTEKYKSLSFLSFIFNFFERLAIKNSSGVLAVCDTLKEIADKNKAPKSVILNDISLHEIYPQITPKIDFRKELNLNNKTKTLVYVGNLESYQGIDLLIDSAKFIEDNLKIIIIGGSDEHIKFYKNKAFNLDLDKKIVFLGGRPLKYLHHYLDNADILASPRISGTNTPMKVYSYMFSKTPIVATDIKSHTQALSAETAILAKTNPKAYGEAINFVLNNEDKARKTGENANLKAKNNYSLKAFEETLSIFYSSLRF